MTIRPVVAPTEVRPKPVRRTFTAEYKVGILAEAKSVSGKGAIGALLRREGLYSSHLVDWRVAAERGALEGMSKKRGPTPAPRDKRDDTIVELERALALQKARTERAEKIIAIQKKVAELLGTALEDPSDKSS